MGYNTFTIRFHCSPTLSEVWVQHDDKPQRAVSSHLCISVEEHIWSV